MDYLIAFLVGGLICVIGQIILDTTSLTPAHIIVTLIIASIGGHWGYEPVVKFAEQEPLYQYWALDIH